MSTDGLGRRRRRLVTSASLIAVALGVTGACTGDRDARGRAGGPDDGVVRAEPLPTIPAIVPAMPSEPSAELLRQERRYQFPDPFGSLQLEHGVAPVMLPPGEHVADSLGIEVTLRLDRWWRLEAEEPGSFWITRPDAPVGGLLPAVVFLRPRALAPINRVGDVDLFRGEHTLPPDDLGGWLDQVDQIEVLDRGDASVGGRDGSWFDIDVVDDAGPLSHLCDPGHCVHTWWSGASRSTVARDLESIRYYSFPDPEGPIYVLIAAADDEFAEWNALATDLLAATDFGPSAPHPVEPGVSVGFERAHERGDTSSFVEFPELEITVPLFSLSAQRPGILTVQGWRAYGHESRPEFVRPVETIDGDPIADVAAVESLLVDTGLERASDDHLLDGTRSVFDGVVDGAILRRTELAPGDDLAFVAWPEFERTHARIWVIDGPRGPLIMSATSSSAANLPSAIRQAEDLMAATEIR